MTDDYFQKQMAEFGTEVAFRRALPFSETAVLSEILPYLKRTLNLVHVDALTVEDAKSKEGLGYTQSIIDSAEPGSPAFEYRNE
jgi:leucyl-tRNA synthetase